MITPLQIKRRLVTAAFSILFFMPLISMAQTKFQGVNLPVAVSGTSSLHDWTMKSAKATCDANITIGKDKISITLLSFTVPVESLKSGKSAMDKNAYKAMNSKKNAGISFVITSANNIVATAPNTYVFSGMGKLTIAGVSKQTPMTATLKYNPTDKSFTCTGTKSFKMTDYGVKPPTAVFGTIKTGDAITINYVIRIKS